MIRINEHLKINRSLIPCVFLLTLISCSTTSQKNKNASAKSSPNRSVAFWYDMGSSGESSMGSALSAASASWWLQPLSSGSGGRQQHMNLLGALDSAAEKGQDIMVASSTTVEDMVHINIEVPTSTAGDNSPSRTVAATSSHVLVRSARALEDSFKDSGYDLETFIKDKDMKAQVKVIPPPSSKSPVAEYRIHLIEKSVDIGGGSHGGRMSSSRCQKTLSMDDGTINLVSVFCRKINAYESSHFETIYGKVNESNKISFTFCPVFPTRLFTGRLGQRDGLWRKIGFLRP